MEKQEWISTKKQLPTNYDEVLVCYYNSELHFTSVHIDRYDGYGRWEELQHSYNTLVWSVTYWMPLPEAPQEVE